MTQFAQFDSTISAPSPGIGWYDTTELTYPSLPIPADLLAITPAQWAERMTGQWAVSGGALVAYVSPAPTPTLAQQVAKAIGAGLVITCTLTPSVSATYDTSDASQALFAKMFNLIQRSGGSAFPFGQSSIQWPAMISEQPAVITFTNVATFLAIEDAVSKFVFTCDQIVLTNSGTLPATSITLAI